MKIIVVGASGKIGSKVVDALSDRHDIVRVGAHSGDVECDYTDKQSIMSMYKYIAHFDALVAVAGRDSAFKPFEELEDEDYKYGFERKFLGQIRLVGHGIDCIRDNGSFTLTSGFLSHYPNPYSVAIGPLNSAVNMKPGIPPVTAVAIQMNTDDTSNGAEAFVKTISLYKKKQK